MLLLSSSSSAPQPALASTGWLVGGGADPDSAAVLASFQKRVAEAVTLYEENLWRELDPEVAAQLTQTEAEVRKLSGMLQVLRDEVENEKKLQDTILRDFKTQLATGMKPSVDSNRTSGRSAALSMASSGGGGGGGGGAGGAAAARPSSGRAVYR